jgi:hypothetical protein
MNTDPELEARLRALAEQEPQPRTSDAVLHGILARRAAGERITLPVAAPRRFPVWLFAGAAAAVLVALVFSRTTRELQQVAAFPPSTPDTALQVTEMGGFLLPAPLMAQATREPRYQRVPESGGDRLRPGRWFYTQRGLGRLTNVGDTLSAYGIARSTYQGADAWIFLGGRRFPDGRTDWSDTTWLSRDSLRPYARVARIGESGRIEETWREDGVLIGETVNGYTAWRTRPHRYPGFVTTEGAPMRWHQLLARLQTADMAPGWKGSLAIPGVMVDGRHQMFLDVAVIREEIIEVPAGKFDCWKVGLGREEKNGLFFWVSKDRGWLVAIGATWDGVQRYGQVLVEGENF